MARGALGVDHVAQRVRLDGAHHRLARRQRLRLCIHDRLELDVARVRLAHDVLGDLLLQQPDAARVDALERHGRRRQPVPQAGEVAGHGSGCEDANGRGDDGAVSVSLLPMFKSSERTHFRGVELVSEVSRAQQHALIPATRP